MRLSKIFWGIVGVCMAVCSPMKGQTVRDSVLVIAAGTKSIAAEAYTDREDFNAVEFESPCVLTSIGEYAFLGCRHLREINLPKSVTKLGEGTFRECESLTTASLPGVVKIPKQCFSWCDNLVSVSLSKRFCNDIGAQAFAYCTSLQSIEIPIGVSHIGANAFSFCKSLKWINLSANVRELESYAFSECSDLKEATLPGNSHMLGELIFSGCVKLEQITVDSPQPPTFDCDSALFDPGQDFLYGQCTLRVPAKSVSLYQDSSLCWHLFKTISPIK